MVSKIEPKCYRKLYVSKKALCDATDVVPVVLLCATGPIDLVGRGKTEKIIIYVCKDSTRRKVPKTLFGLYLSFVTCPAYRPIVWLKLNGWPQSVTSETTHSPDALE